MIQLPTPKLGNIYAVTITSADLERSLSFYQKLGFTEVLRSDWPFPIIQISDGALLIMLRQDNSPYIALTYYVNDIDQLVSELEKDGIVFTIKPNPKDMLKRCLMKSPDGMNVSLVQMVDGFSQPKGATLLTTPPQEYKQPEKYVNKVCGMFGEIAHPVSDIDQAMQFWEKLGFKMLSRMTSPYPWAIISDGLSIVGLHRTNNFSAPTITFFASDMKEKIEQLKASGITEQAEKGSSSNVTLSTPEGQFINLFTLGF